MIDNCLCMLTRFCHRSVTSLWVRSLWTSAARSSRKKIIMKNKHGYTQKNKAVVWQGMQIKELAKAMDTEVSKVMQAICRVMGSDEKLAYSMEIDDTFIISAAARLCGYSVEVKHKEKPVKIIDKDAYSRNIYLNKDRLKSRPPIVTIMGHVDHGKTTLLDSLRSSRVVDSEFGGITQHIGAFKVKLSDISGTAQSGKSSLANEIVTFLDTPGHAAFSLMRSRGVRCTDIVVLVVSIDDGLMPQTLESIRFAQEAKVPIIVVINKIDRIVKSIADLGTGQSRRLFETIHHSLSVHGVVVEELGGDVQCIPISALKKWNLDLLQESILALAEYINVRCDYEGDCEGVVLEAKVVAAHGKVATVLLQQGTLRPGSFLVAGQSYGKVRTMRNDQGALVEVATPGDPVELSGWKDVLPDAGDVVLEVAGLARAKEVVQYRLHVAGSTKATQDYAQYERTMGAYKEAYKAYLEEGFQRGYRLWRERPELTDFVSSSRVVNGKELPQLNVMIKTDVHGSLEAIADVLEVAIEACADQCSIKVAHIGVGNLTDSDAKMAAFTGAVVYLFNLPQCPPVDDDMGLDVRSFNVIYHLFDDLRAVVASRLTTIEECEVVGEAEVMQMFEVREGKEKVPVIGCKCTSGALYRDNEQYYFRVARRVLEAHDQSSEQGQGQDRLEEQLVEDRLTCRSLRHLRNDVDSIKRGVDCGIVLVDGHGVPVTVNSSDVVQCCKTVHLSQKLNWDLGYQ